MKENKYQGRQPPSHITNVMGPIGESIVSRPIFWTLDDVTKERIIAEQTEVLLHILSFNDDRILAIHGAILVENTLDNHLNDFIPGYKSLLENSNYTFSMKIDLSKALSICPKKIYESANTIRKIRNDFAHNLQFRSLADVPKRIKTVRQNIKGFLPEFGENESDKDALSRLITEVASSINMYRPSIQAVNTMLRSGDESLLKLLEVHKTG